MKPLPIDERMREWFGDGTGGDHNEEGVYYTELLVWELDNIPKPE